MVLGGSKVSDKLAVIEALAPKVDTLVIGGGMFYTFLAAQGVSVGNSLCEESMIETCKDLLDRYADVIHIPQDVVVADSFSADAESKIVPFDKIPDGWMGLDIGPESVKRFAAILTGAKTVFWNGPMGVFEFPKFEAGTRGVARQSWRQPRRRLQRRRRRRLRSSRSSARYPGRGLLAHFHRWWRFPRVPRGQRAAWHRSTGS